MAFDAAFLQFAAKELEDKLSGAFVDKIYQPSKDEIMLSFRGRGKARLMISCSPGTARIHLTERAVENPKVPPNFCMVLRKHLLNARLKRVYTPAFERVIMLCFEGKNDFFEPVEKTLLLEIMGRTSNIILIDTENRIINSIKHVDLSMTRHRQILPGLKYELPPRQGKVDIIDATGDEPWDGAVEKELWSAIIDTYSGISPIVAREIAYRSVHAVDRRISELSTPAKQKVRAEIMAVREQIVNGDWQGCLIRQTDTEKVIDLCFMPITQYQSGVKIQSFTEPSALLEECYTRAADSHRIKQKASDLSDFLTRTAARIRRTKAVREKELSASEQADKYQMYGQLIQANLYQLKRGDKSLKTQNFYEADLPEITVPLRPELSPNQNAQQYFKKYAKAKNGRRIIAELIEKDKKELEYLDSVYVALCDAENEEDLEQIRAELVEGRYLKARSLKGSKAPGLSHPREFVTDDGFTVLVGKSNLQNDYLTVRLSRKNDIWMHTKGIHGSHALLVTHGKELNELPDNALLQAAAVCAYYSKGKESGKVEVDYCPVQNVHKPAGAKPGMVIYDHYYTLVTAPDEHLTERIRKK